MNDKEKIIMENGQEVQIQLMSEEDFTEELENNKGEEEE